MTPQEIHQGILEFELKTMQNTGWDIETVENQDFDLLSQIMIADKRQQTLTTDEFLANGGVAGLLRG